MHSHSSFPPEALLTCSHQSSYLFPFLMINRYVFCCSPACIVVFRKLKSTHICKTFIKAKLKIFQLLITKQNENIAIQIKIKRNITTTSKAILFNIVANIVWL